MQTLNSKLSCAFVRTFNNIESRSISGEGFLPDVSGSSSVTRTSLTLPGVVEVLSADTFQPAPVSTPRSRSSEDPSMVIPACQDCWSERRIIKTADSLNECTKKLWRLHTMEWRINSDLKDKLQSCIGKGWHHAIAVLRKTNKTLT